MLIEFRVDNHRSIGDEQALSMGAGRVGAPDDPRPREITGHKTQVLPVAALYGANASGKSNVLSALDYMRYAIISSHRRWAPEGGVPRTPFAWGAKSSEPSLFEVTFVQEGVRYQYGFVANDKRFLEEWLYAWPARRKQSWFEREGDDFKFGEHLRGENRLVAQVTRDNALFLSTAVQHRILRYPTRVSNSGCSCTSARVRARSIDTACKKCSKNFCPVATSTLSSIKSPAEFTRRLIAPGALPRTPSAWARDSATPRRVSTNSPNRLPVPKPCPGRGRCRYRGRAWPGDSAGSGS